MKTVFALLLLATSVSYAQSELRSKAMAEAQTPRVAQNSATDAQVFNQDTSESVLKLQDTEDVNVKRNYNWVFGVKVQDFQPSGKMTSEDKAGVFLSDISPFYLPSLEGGIRRLGNEGENSRWHWNVLGRVGYATQKSHIHLASPRGDSEARLATLLSDVSINFDYEPTATNWGLNTGIGIGNLGYSHSGSSAFSQFSEQAAFRSFTLGAHLNVPGNWQILANYINRNLLNETSSVAMPTDAFELGTRFIW